MTEFVIVIGHRGKEIRDSIELSRPNLPITWGTNPDWEKQNGVSVLAAESYARDRFLLTMADHLFFPENGKASARAKLLDGEALLAIDRKVAACPDLDERPRSCSTKIESRPSEKTLPLSTRSTPGSFIAAALCSRLCARARGRVIARYPTEFAPSLRLAA